MFFIVRKYLSLSHIGYRKHQFYAALVFDFQIQNSRQTMHGIISLKISWKTLHINIKNLNTKLNLSRENIG